MTGALGDQCGYIEDLARDGIFSTGSLYFNPESSIDRAEEVKIILKTLGYTGSTISAGYTDTSTVDSTTLLYINQIHALGCDYYNSTEFYPTAGVSRGELYKVTACVASLSPAHITERNTSFYGYRESQNGVNELWSVSGLLEDTTYYYHVDVCTRIVCDQSGITMMFRTPKIVPLILT